MKTVTNEFKENIKINGRQLDTIITIDNIPFQKENFNSITPKFNTNLFKTIMKGVEIDSNFYILKNSKVNVKSGVLVNNEYEYIDYGNYLAYKEAEINEDTKSWKTTVYDKIIESMIDYDLTVTYPISVRNYWLAIFNKLNWDISGIPETFTNSSKMINSDVHSGIGYTYRDVLDELCTISGVFLIDKGGIPTIITPEETNQVIDETYLKDTNVTVGEKVFFNSLVFARAEESDNIYRKDDTSIEENGLHEFRIADNQLLSTNDRVDYIEELWEYIKTFEYYSFDVDTIGVMFMEPVDRFTISANSNNYSTILLNDTTTISQGLTENMYSEIPEETETEYKYADTTDRKINQTYIIVDKQNQKIEAVVQSNQEVVSKTAQLSIEVDELKGQISEVADVTITADGYGIINAEKINVSEPIMLRIRPNGEDFALLYPRKNLYPSSNLYPKNRKITFENLTTKKKIEYIIPKDLWYLDNNNYDEFILDYENLQCYINRKIGVNADGTKYMLELPTIEELDYPTINLTEGDYKIYTNSFSNAYIYVRLMTQNIYTSQFATKVELNSSITQTSKEINLSVDKKIQDLDTQLSSDITQTSNSIMAEVNGKIDTLDEDINAKLELKVDTKNLVSEINASADKINLTGDRIIIDSTNLKVAEDGTLTATNGEFTGTINGGTINGSSINTDKNLTVGNNVYVGQNQSTEAVDLKYMYFDNENYIRRAKTSFFNIIEMHSQQRSSMFAGNDSNNAQIETSFLDNSPTIDLSFTVNNTQRPIAQFSNDYIRFLHQPVVTSDKRLKKNIKDIEVNWIKDLKVKQFEYKNDIIKNKYIGLVAQEYQDKDYAKYFLDKDEKGFYSINYGNITNALIKYVQQLEKRIEVLENENIGKN